MTNANTSPDLIHRFLFEGEDLRGEITSLEQSFAQAIAHQNLPPKVKILLGEFLAAASLLAEILKFEGILTLQARGDGPIPMIMAEASDNIHIRGIAKTGENFSSLDAEETDFRKLIGNGVLTLTIDPKKGQRYQGIVPIEKATLADCINDYFAQSEQLPTRIWLAANENCAAGLQIQALPSEEAKKESAKACWETAEALAHTVKPEELLNLDHASLLYRLFNEFNVRLFEGKSISFACSCSRERSLNALNAIGREDAEALIAERDWIEIDCQFCGTQYRFGAQDLDQAFNAANHKLH